MFAFAELECLAALTGEPSQAVRLPGFPGTASADVVRAGLSSLVMRGEIEVGDDRISCSSVGLGVGVGLSLVTQWITLTPLGSRVLPTHFGVSADGRVRMLISALGAGVFAVGALSPDGEPTDRFAEFVRSVTTESPEVTMSLSGPGGALAVRADVAGSFLAGPGAEQLGPIGEQELQQAIADLFGPPSREGQTA